MFRALGSILARYSGKKFAALVLGIAAVAVLVDSYLAIESPTEQTGRVYVAAILGVAIVAGAAGLGIGIADHGKGARGGDS